MLGILALILVLATIYLGASGFPPIWIVWMALAYTPIYVGMRLEQFAVLFQRGGAGSVIGMLIWTVVAELITAAVFFYIGVGTGMLF